jgi:hypothetical protein
MHRGEHGAVSALVVAALGLSVILVASLDRLGLPVRPEERVLKHREGKDVMQSEARVAFDV